MTDLDKTFALDIKAAGITAAFKVEAPSELVINLNGPVGRLFEKDGKLHYEGDLHESASVFFDYLCKSFWVDIEKLRQETARAQANEKEALRQLASCRAFDGPK